MVMNDRLASSGVWQQHPYLPVVAEGTQLLLLGSAPPFRFCLPGTRPLKPKDLDFYYGSCTNLFWDILVGALEPQSLGRLSSFRDRSIAVELRTAGFREFAHPFLGRYHLGLADILRTFTRRDGSAADYHLEVVDYLDLLVLLRQHGTIRKILCTSRNRVHYWLTDYLEKGRERGDIRLTSTGDEFCYRNVDAGNAWSDEVSIGILPSPSARGIMRYPNRQAFLAASVLSYRTQLLPISSADTYLSSNPLR